MTGRLARLLERPRLAGAQAFIKQLSGALALPPRRLIEADLPVGGYANVTTRGRVEQLLPSQFAMPSAAGCRCPFPYPQPGAALAVPPLNTMWVTRHTLQIVGLGTGGSLCWLALTFDGDRLVHHVVRSMAGPYLAAAVTKPGRIVAFDQNSISFLRASEHGITEQSRQPWVGPEIIACFMRQETREAITVNRNGTLSLLLLAE